MYHNVNAFRKGLVCLHEIETLLHPMTATKHR